MNKSTVHESYEAATAACTGKSKVFKVTMGGKTFWVVSHNQVRAGHAALIAAEGKVELAAKAPKPMSAAEVLAAYSALTQEERDALKTELKKVK